MFAEIVGDPDSEFDRLLEASPLYHLDRLAAALLIVVSEGDGRVHPEHGRRLAAMLDRLGKPYERQDLRGGHSPSLAEWKRLAWRLQQFLREHLVSAPVATGEGAEPPGLRT